MDSLSNWWNSLIFGPDYNVSQDTAMALGFDTSTGTFVAPQYAATFAKNNPGVDPGTFVANAQQDAIALNDSQTGKDFQSLGGFSFLPGSPVVGGDAAALNSLIPSIPGLPDVSGIVLIVILIAVAFLAIEAVK